MYPISLPEINRETSPYDLAIEVHNLLSTWNDVIILRWLAGYFCRFLSIHTEYIIISMIYASCIIRSGNQPSIDRIDVETHHLLILPGIPKFTALTIPANVCKSAESDWPEAMHCSNLPSEETFFAHGTRSSVHWRFQGNVTEAFNQKREPIRASAWTGIGSLCPLDRSVLNYWDHLRVVYWDCGTVPARLYSVNSQKEWSTVCWDLSHVFEILVI